MRIIADLRALINSQPVTALSDKAFAGSLAFPVASYSDFGINNFILIGDLSSETAEMAQISAMGGGNITLSNALLFDHPQDTVVTLIQYNEVVFYYSPTISGSLSALTAGIPITPDSNYTYYDDVSNSTGYGWFNFYNSQTSLFSVLSNPVPYTDFDPNSVKKMLDRFYTQIGNREKKLIKDSDVIEWCNEAYTIALNRLNLVNREYTVPVPYMVNIIAGTAEYPLPPAFNRVRSFNMNDGTPIDTIATDGIMAYGNTTLPINVTLTPMYYLRGAYIGLTPTPTVNDSYFLYYTTTSTTLSSYIDYFNLPNNNFYFILDYLLYRATPIIGGDGPGRLKLFQNGLDDLIVTSHKRTGDASTFDKDTTAIV